MLNPKLRTRFEDLLLLASWKFLVGYFNVKRDVHKFDTVFLTFLTTSSSYPHPTTQTTWYIKQIKVINFLIDLCSTEIFSQIFTKFPFCYCLDKFLAKTIYNLINSPPIWLKFHNTILVPGAKDYSWKKWPFSPSIIVENLFAERSSWLVIF